MKKKGFFERLRRRGADDEDHHLQELDKNALEMVQGIVSLSESNVREIMVPRIDVVSISLNTQIAEIIKVVSDCGHSRFPVYHETIDNIVGVLHAKDLLRYLGKNGEDFLSDGIIHVKMEKVDDVNIQRRVRVVKMRGTNHSPHYHALLFSKGEFQATQVISDMDNKF